MVRYAVGLPVVGEFGDPLVLTELSVRAEEAGWDGVYLWDHVLYHHPRWDVASPVVALAAIAARMARETVSLDRLSGGRLVFGAGLGSMDAEYAGFGEDPDLRARAVRLDESLDALVALWTGEPVTLRGSRVLVDGVQMRPGPVQRPRIPVWCAGRWPNRPGLRRAARWDGVMPTFVEYGRDRPVPPEVFAAAVRFVAAERGSLDGFDVALEGWTEPDTAARTVAAYAEAGLTWWVEAMGWWRGGVAGARERITAGPP